MGRSYIDLVGNTTQGMNLGSGSDVFKDKLCGNILQFRSLVATGSSIQLFETENEIRISGSTGGGGGINWTGTQTDGIGTYVNSSTICSESNLTFNGTRLSVTGNICTSTCIMSSIVSGSTCSVSPLHCGACGMFTTCSCSPLHCGACIIGASCVQSPTISGISGIFTTCSSSPLHCGACGMFTTCSCSPLHCGACVIGTTCVQSPTISGISGIFTTCSCSPLHCGACGMFTTCSCSPLHCGACIIGASCVRSPLISGISGIFTTCSSSPLHCGGCIMGTTCVCSPWICSSTCICGSKICASAISGGTICATTCLKSPILQQTNVAAKTTETSVAFFKSDGCLVSGTTGGGGISWSGTQADGIGTYVDANTVCSEPNLTFNGSLLNITGCVCATTCIKSPKFSGTCYCAYGGFTGATICSTGVVRGDTVCGANCIQTNNCVQTPIIRLTGIPACASGQKSVFINALGCLTTGTTSTGYVTGATNGLTKVGQKVGLGGSLTGNTCICLTSGCLMFCDTATNASNTFGTLGTIIGLNNSCFYLTNSGADFRLISCYGKCVELGNSGLTYGDNYSSTFKARSLVDKAYVDSVVGGAGGGNVTGCTPSAMYQIPVFHNTYGTLICCSTATIVGSKLSSSIISGVTCAHGDIVCGTTRLTSPLTCGACGMFTTCSCSPWLCSSTCICGTKAFITFITGATCICTQIFCAITCSESPLHCGACGMFTTCACSPVTCGSSYVVGAKVCGATCVGTPILSGTTCSTAPVTCGSSYVVGAKVCGTTCVGTPILSGTTCSVSPLHCGACGMFTTCACSPWLCSSTCIIGSKICSPFITGGTCMYTQTFCANTCVCTPVLCATTCVAAPITCGSSYVVGAKVCGTTCVGAPILSGTTCSVSPVHCGACIMGTTCVCSLITCGSSYVIGGKICGTTCVGSPILSATTCSYSACRVGTKINVQCISGATCICSVVMCAANCFTSPCFRGTAGCFTYLTGSSCVIGTVVCSTNVMCAGACLMTPCVCVTALIRTPNVQHTSIAPRTTETAAAFFSPDGCLLSGTTGGGGINWTGTQADGLGTYVNSSTICSETNLTFNGSQLCVNGNVKALCLTGSTCIRSPLISGTTYCATSCVKSICFSGTTYCATNLVCSSCVHANLCICTQIVCATSAVCGPVLCGTLYAAGACLCAPRACVGCLTGSTSIRTGILQLTNVAAKTTETKGAYFKSDGCIVSGTSAGDVMSTATGAASRIAFYITDRYCVAGDARFTFDSGSDILTIGDSASDTYYTQITPCLYILCERSVGDLVKFCPDVANTTNCVVHTFNTVSNLTASGIKLMSIRNNGIEKFNVDKDGVISGSSCVRTPTLQLTNVAAKTTETCVAFFKSDGCLVSGTSSSATGTACTLATFNASGNLDDSYIIHDNTTRKIVFDDGTASTWCICGRCGNVSVEGGAALTVCAGSNYAGGTSNAGNLNLSAGDNTTGAGYGGGSVYISPGIQASTNTIGQIFLGKSTYTSTAIELSPTGTQSNISIYLWQKGNGSINIGCPTGSIIFQSNSVGINGVVYWCCTGKMQFNHADTAYICGSMGAIDTAGCNLVLMGGCGYPSGDRNGGNLILCGGTPYGAGSVGRIQLCTLPAKTTETCVIYIGTNGCLASGTSTGGGISWNGSTTNGVGTYVDANNICSQPNLIFNGTRLALTGNLCASSCVMSPIISGGTCAVSPIVCSSTCVRGVVVSGTTLCEGVNTLCQKYGCKYIEVRLLGKDTDVAICSNCLGGDFRVPEAMTLVCVGAYVDVAGVTNSTCVDILEGSVSVLSTKIIIETGEKTSKDATTQPVISDSAIAADGILTFGVTAVSTTAPKGLTVWMKVTIP